MNLKCEIVVVLSFSGRIDSWRYNDVLALSNKL